ncbi:unannotated protein [freshwater metagenome]|uniref:Unannotated protein n=1 Tax=freshwater metagenome TaxID=449393 RepID=A0A6J6T5N7_9ZZZZ
MIRKPGSATGAIWSNAMILNQETFLPNLFKAPPNTFYIFWSHSPIGLIKINPETHAVGHRCEGTDVASYRFAAHLIKGSNSIFFNVAFSRKSQLFFNSNFNWQTVAIPTCFAGYIFALHCLITRKDIFKDARFNVVGARHTVSSWWAFIEGPRLAANARRSTCLED